MEKNYLPIGSVVLLRGGEKRLVIIGRIQVMEGSDKIYDYSGCLYPEGVMGQDSLYFFDQEDIEIIYFIGFQDQEELSYRFDYLEQLGELEVRGDVIVEKESNAGDADLSGKKLREDIDPFRITE